MSTNRAKVNLKLKSCLFACICSLSLAGSSVKEILAQPKHAGKAPAGPGTKPAESPGGWNSDLSNMMDNLEMEVKPGAKPPAPGKEALDPAEHMDSAPPPIPPLDWHAPDAASKPLGDDRLNYLNNVQKAGLARWERDSMPLKVYVEPRSTVRGFRSTFPGLIKAAFEQWSSISEAKLSIKFVDSPGDAQINCTWTDNLKDLMSENEGGITVVTSDDRGLVRAEMKILTLHGRQQNAIPDDDYMRNTALHEAGHALGISGHSGESNDVMFPVGNHKLISLSDRDKRTLIALYSLPKEQIAENKRSGLTGDQALAASKDPKARAILLNNEAAASIQKREFDIAIAKLEEARKLDPANKMVVANLGALYANCGAIAGMMFNVAAASSYYKKAIPLLEQSGNRAALVPALTNYEKLLRMQQMSPAGTTGAVDRQKTALELNEIEAKLNKLRP